MKTENRLENLEYCTRSENQWHRFKVLWHKGTFYKKNWSLHPRSKKVWMYNIDWVLLEKFDSMNLWAKRVKWTVSNISKCCKWIYKIAYWYKWKYIN